MEKFRDKLSKSRRKNVDGCWYVPRRAIDTITDRDTISQIISEKNLSGHETDAVLGKALRGNLEQIILVEAKVTFAISCYARPPCLRQIVSLIKYADERGSKVDNRLPLSQEELCRCGFDDEHAAAFDSTQWGFIAPKIRLGAFVPSEFGPEVILPFRFDRGEPGSPLDTGAFGTITEVCVEEGHQVEPAYLGRVSGLVLVLAILCQRSRCTQIVRKQFHHGTSKTLFLRELRNLCILSSARHENIVQLLGAYVQNNSFNLIFPVACHGNLDQLFHSDSPSSWAVMASEDSILMALSGLASALVTMHEFTAENIRLIGCHRDLKPANILVDGQQFLLADFGLSRIVDEQGTSSSMAPNIAGDFIAPEHEDRDKDFIRNPIGRSSDIWAFGCVTLMLLVFLQEGKRGLDQLESKRRVEWPNYAHHCFHDYNRPNPGLEEPFQSLASSQLSSIRGLLYLVKRVLVLEKNLRPKARAIDAHIRCVIIHTWSKSIEEEFGKACKSDYIHVHFERARFRGWRSAVKISDSEFPEFREGSTHQRFGNFKLTVEHLQQLQGMLVGFSNGPINQGRKAFLPVRCRIDRLLEALDNETRAAAVAHTECMMLQSKNRIWLLELQKLSEKTLDKRTGSKVATRQQILRPSSSEELYVDFVTLEPRPHSKMLSQVRKLSNEGPEPDLVLAEEAHTFSGYRNSQAYTYDPQRSPSRLQEIANLLASSGENGLFNVLKCRGYYHHPAERRSGLLYELPNGSHGKLESVTTLQDIIRSGTTTWCLGDRFHLAQGLATAVYELHSVAWLHRNVSASNIAFFYNNTKDEIDPKLFYFVGFAQSRADIDFTDSDGPLFGDEYYHHPEYLSQGQGYQMQHDYYALGILLLEIGLWKPLPDALSGRPANLANTRELVRQLGWNTGSCYRDAVEACLDGTLSDASISRHGQKVPLDFWDKVVDQLSSNHCRA